MIAACAPRPSVPKNRAVITPVPILVASINTLNRKVWSVAEVLSCPFNNQRILAIAVFSKISILSMECEITHCQLKLFHSLLSVIFHLIDDCGVMTFPI